ncbi:hypothetical protein HDC30_004114 [Pseudomonas sp. JAI115]|uniref:DUF4123 domain-containing protein n=1 Tax=Pseudomonas sp. JAI115 TaxID=2723061 RepID=UPI00160A1C2A|nr:DUF4123 domain-containing protein [Pseudomonas sp. JAI115]MBB6156871.1 hypothetical protein [Pseudomonas sp. JAI115]
MTNLSPLHWMAEQRQLGRSLCLILDSEGELPLRKTLMDNQATNRYCNLYSGTLVADLASTGPFIFLVDGPEDRRLNELLKEPERNWGWLASIPRSNGLEVLADHWRDRIIVGTRPHQALYRFQDNRVLARALAFFGADVVPEYLGPVNSVFYWQGVQWKTASNPKPNRYPVPNNPAWLNVPSESDQAASIRETNAHRYLLAYHLDAYLEVAERQEPEEWLRKQLMLVDAWGWESPEQLEFVLIESLRVTIEELEKRWQVQPNENPEDHFQRIYHTMQFWQGEAPL